MELTDWEITFSSVQIVRGGTQQEAIDAAIEALKDSLDSDGIHMIFDVEAKDYEAETEYGEGDIAVFLP